MQYLVQKYSAVTFWSLGTALFHSLRQDRDANLETDKAYLKSLRIKSLHQTRIT
jgi:hypothetical protein